MARIVLGDMLDPYSKRFRRGTDARDPTGATRASTPRWSGPAGKDRWPLRLASREQAGVPDRHLATFRATVRAVDDVVPAGT